MVDSTRASQFGQSTNKQQIILIILSSFVIIVVIVINSYYCLLTISWWIPPEPLRLGFQEERSPLGQCPLVLGSGEIYKE